MGGGQDGRVFLRRGQQRLLALYLARRGGTDRVSELGRVAGGRRVDCSCRTAGNSALHIHPGMADLMRFHAGHSMCGPVSQDREEGEREERWRVDENAYLRCW